MIRGCPILGSQGKYFFAIYSHLKCSKNTSESCTQNLGFEKHFLLLNIETPSLFFFFFISTWFCRSTKHFHGEFK